MKCAWCGLERGEQGGPCPRCQFVPPGQSQDGGRAQAQPGGQGLPRDPAPPFASAPTANHAPAGRGSRAPPSAFEPTAKHAPVSRGPELDATATFDAPSAFGGDADYQAGPTYQAPGGGFPPPP